MQHLQKLSMMQSSTGNGWVMASYEFHRIGYYQEMIIILYHNWTLNMQKNTKKYHQHRFPEINIDLVLSKRLLNTSEGQ